MSTHIPISDFTRVEDNGPGAYTITVTEMMEHNYDLFTAVTCPHTGGEEYTGFYLRTPKQLEMLVLDATGLCEDDWVDYWVFRTLDRSYECVIMNDVAIELREGELGVQVVFEDD